MNHLHVKYLLVGGGIAASSAAKAIRSLDRQGGILLINQEPTRPYHRPPLWREALRDRLGKPRFSIEPPGWYGEHGIELRTGRRAAHLDPARSAVMLDDGQEVSYDRLLIATGASPKHLVIPGHALPGLYYLRTFEDLDRIHHAIDQARVHGLNHSDGRGRVGLIGSGLLATELASSLAQMGLGVDLFLRQSVPWHRFAGESIGKWMIRRLETAGIQIHPAAVRLEGDGRVQRIVPAAGPAVACDLAIAAVGVAPNRDLLRGTSIAAEKAILTDSRGCTSVANVYSAGDCAAILDPLFGKHRTLQQFSSAAHCGDLVGRNMAGAESTFDHINCVQVDALGATVSVLGEHRHVQRRMVRSVGAGDQVALVELGLSADGRISQVIAAGTAESTDVLARLIRQRVQMNGLEEAFRDPSIPLSGLVK